MTNGWTDLANSDVFLIMGANPAENHPCGFKWAIEAKRNRNARMIVVDPRYTRTAATADFHVPIRAGTDLVFVGGLIFHVIENNLFARDYVLHYTNASFIVDDDFRLTEDGVFSGFDEAGSTYDRSSWNYKAHGGTSAPGALPESVPTDPTLQDPRCVFQLLRRHYSRYTPEMVERMTGVSQANFLRVAEEYAGIRRNGDMTKTGNLIYSLGWTHHSTGTQTIRTGAILQLLLGNVGRPGGGVNALRGHANVQGATDVAISWDSLPGYLKPPMAADGSFASWMKRITPTQSKPNEWASLNYWSNTPKFAVSLQKSLYGPAATAANGWCYDYMPKRPEGRGWWALAEEALAGKVDGAFCFGMNILALSACTGRAVSAFSELDWLVVCEIFPDETSEFWRAPMITPEQRAKINTTVYRLPGAGFSEKPGTMVNSGRVLQWRDAATPPVGDAKIDLEILAQIFLRVRNLYKKDGGAFPDPILNLTWDYADPERPSAEELAKELNGKALAPVTNGVRTFEAGTQLPDFSWLRDDGTTASGCWIYCGSWPETGSNAKRRGTDDPSGLGIFPNWAWSWPLNRRILYNRASCDLEGKPWDPKRAAVWWDESAGKWQGHDVLDFPVTSPPKAHMGPFIMTHEGVGRLFTPLGLLVDGPFPEHYEPLETPTENLFHPKLSANPLGKKVETPFDKFGKPSEGYSAVAFTMRLTETYHWWTKNNPANVQLAPEPYAEINDEMARDLGITGGDFIKISSARGRHICRALVTKRLAPLQINGKRLYQVGIPFSWGFRGISEDAGRTSLTLVNELTPTSYDANTRTPEYKTFLVKVEKVEKVTST
jgi:formate dehydrogenase major subunit